MCICRFGIWGLRNGVLSWSLVIDFEGVMNEWCVEMILGLFIWCRVWCGCVVDGVLCVR